MTRGLWPLVVGFGIWAAAFNALYAAHALGCFWHWPEPVHRTVLVGLYLITLGALAATLMLYRKRATGTFAGAGFMLTLCALVASVVVFAPAAFMTICL